MCEKTFQEMKATLTESPVLVFPYFRKKFILNTDENSDTIGAVLSQKDDNGHEHVTVYGSHAMETHEKGYCITRNEPLAVYYICQHFNRYLYGKRFTLRTNHKAITFMMKTKKPITAQFQTWINYLSSLDIKMEFRKEILHTNADTMSGKSCETCTQYSTQHEDSKLEKMRMRLLTITTNEKEWQNERIKEGIGKIRDDRFHIKKFEYQKQ